MTTRTPDDDGPRPGEPAQSRLEREVAEILERTDREPISFTEEARKRGSHRRRITGPEPARPRSAALPSRNSMNGSDLVARFERLGRGRYLMLAVVAALLALVVSDFSPLLAMIFAIVCVAAIFIPVVQQFRNPQPPEVRTWRGRDMSIGASRPAGIERIFDRFRRPPRI
ncbi:MAG TPA: hypothetical protein VGT61_05110 [Thermomicrobiales bacterium]|jgi:hypothetical protein|nr:hypothetical protein [Thermomicrobiales bacterium]